MTEDKTRVVLWPEEPGGKWRVYEDPVHIIRADDLDAVLPALRSVENGISEGLHATGFISYEASPAFDPACVTHSAGDLPLLWFGLFNNPAERTLDEIGGIADFSVADWKPSISATDYETAIGQIKDYLASGDTYQVNYTMRLAAAFEGDPWSFFRQLLRTQTAGHCTYVESPGFTICSVSPEQFLKLDGRKLSSRPMKGTSQRGLTCESDNRLAKALQNCEKNQAENVMIVDMVRNDMGRVAKKGSVHVPSLYDIERYPTLLQMTSTVAAKTDSSLTGILKALFPCASITGAPKVRTMEIIKELEPSPRGIYTGCIGVASPGRQIEFNVAIRTVTINAKRSAAEYGVGGGIVWDSLADSEYEECMVKAAVLTERRPEFRLLETMLWDPEDGYFLLDLHMERLSRAAKYCSFPLNLPLLRGRLGRQSDERMAAVSRGAEMDQDVDTNDQDLEQIHQDRSSAMARVLADEDGEVEIQWTTLEERPVDEPMRIALARSPIDRSNWFMYQKTTNRAVYEQAKADFPDHDEVILWNEDGEITEGTYTSVIIDKNSRLVTPPVTCGLLPGTYRQFMLTEGKIEEGIVTKDDLITADRIFVANSVRGMILAALDEP